VPFSFICFKQRGELLLFFSQYFDNDCTLGFVDLFTSENIRKVLDVHARHEFVHHTCDIAQNPKGSNRVRFQRKYLAAPSAKKTAISWLQIEGF
jgi:hypothetical protein